MHPSPRVPAAASPGSRVFTHGDSPMQEEALVPSPERIPLKCTPASAFQHLLARQATNNLKKIKRFEMKIISVCLILLWILCPTFGSAQNAKRVIASAADLPKFEYAVPENLGDLL